MKSTGIVRKVDELGRIVLPIELRRTLDIAEKDSLEIYMDGPSIVLKKYQPTCIFCDEAKDVVSFLSLIHISKEELPEPLRGECRVYGADGEFLALGRCEGHKLSTIKSFFSV